MRRFAWEKLRPLREDRGWSLDQVASAVGRDRAWLSRVERGAFVREPGHQIIDGLANVFGVSRDDLLASSSHVQRRSLTDDELFEKIGAGYVEDIPFIEDVMVSAGAGSGIPQDIDDTLPKGRKRRYLKHLRSLVVTGRCLEDELNPGDLVHIDRERPAQIGKLVVAVRDEEEALIKRLVEIDGQRWLTANDGRAPIPVDEHIRILGPVVAFQRRLL